MKRIKEATWLVLASISIIFLMLFSTGSAQLAVKVIGPDGTVLDVTGHNTPRGDEALVLFDTAYGKNTRTNGYGVEVIAVPASQKPAEGMAFQVKQITSVWECDKNEALSCGNAAIPEDGIVLSATGTKRDLLKNLKPGDVLTLQEEWFHRQQSAVNVINPSPENNPAGSGFPGYRASNQLLVYDAGFGRPTTGTNEFGFEVTVRNGIVTDQEGSDSTIPADGYVLSGHGRGRSWLIGNAPIGAKMELSPDGKLITSTIDLDTYLYQFDHRWAESPCALALNKPQLVQECSRLRAARGRAGLLKMEGKENTAASILNNAMENLNQTIWLATDPFPSTTIRGAWHRPVEKTAAAIGQTLDALKASGINAVFLETFFHGYTIFPSQTYAAYGLPEENPKFAGVDLLKLWTEEAHKRGMQVHVWFQTFYGGTKAYNPPGPILAKYPEWANVQYSALIPDTDRDGKPDAKKPPVAAPGTATASPAAKPAAKSAAAKPAIKVAADKPDDTPPLPPKMLTPDKPVPSTLELGGYFLDPANPQVQTFLTKLAEEIVTRYPIDGFQLDYIRYPASFPADRYSFRKTTWGYTKYARNAFKAEYGVDPAEVDPKDPNLATLWKNWADWKTAKVTGFVDKITHDLKARRPAMKISAAIFPEADNALVLKHQDWRSWARNGWLDFLAPMTLTSATKVVDRDTRYVQTVTDSKVPVFSGIFGPFNENSAEQVLEQIDTARKAGATGYVLFDTAHMSARMLQALKAAQVPPEPLTVPASTSPAPVPQPKKKKHWWNRG